MPGLPGAPVFFGSELLASQSGKHKQHCDGHQRGKGKDQRHEQASQRHDDHDDGAYQASDKFSHNWPLAPDDK